MGRIKCKLTRAFNSIHPFYRITRLGYWFYSLLHA